MKMALKGLRIAAFMKLSQDLGFWVLQMVKDTLTDKQNLYEVYT